MSHHDKAAAPDPTPNNPAAPEHPSHTMQHHGQLPTRLPIITDLVIYHSHGSADGTTYQAGERRAAIVTHVHEPASPWSPLDLCVLNPDGIYFAHTCPKGEGPGHWLWP